MALTQVKTSGIAADAVTGAKVADDQIDSEHYIAASIDNEHLANNAVDTDEIADDAVTLAKMDALARGKLIVGDSSGNPSALAAGSDNYVLTMDANGDAGWEAAAGGGATINNATANELVTVASTTTQLDAEANLTFDGTSLVLTGDQMIKANDAAAKLKFKSGNVASDDEELGSVTWQSSADNVNASIAAHRATWANDGYLVFKTASSGTLSEQLRIDRFGNLDVARGNIEIKTAGKGIDFSATSNSAGTMSSELLDDYEEGTFTGTWTAYTSGCSTTQTSTNHYTKIGRQVTCWINASNMSLVGGSGPVKMEGLPFATSSSLGGGATGTAPLTYKVGFDTDMHYTFYTWQSVSFFLGYRSRNGTTWQAWDITEWDTAGAYCQMTFTYFTDS